jgi:murein DD-endopeptidase MepM/ murein hydrolase activator NlpD
MFTAAGAAMATSPRAQTVISPQNASASAVTFASMDGEEKQVRQDEQLRTRQQNAADDNLAKRNLAEARAAAAARVARSAARKKLVARALEVKRAARAHEWAMPITKPVRTSGFGYRWGRLHAGTDYGVPTGTNLASMSTGTVRFAGVQSGYGNLVQIRYWDGTVSYYGHMSSISVNTGEKVERGQVVGQSGNTGRSTGPHLHLEIHPHGGAAVDPVPWMASHKIT